MILLFSRSFRFWRKSSGLATVFWPLLLPSKMNFIYTFFSPAASLSHQFWEVPLFLVGCTRRYLFCLLILTLHPRDALGLVGSSTGTSHWGSCAAESFQAWDSHGDNDVTSFGVSDPRTWVFPLRGTLLLTTPLVALLARCCIVDMP